MITFKYTLTNQSVVCPSGERALRNHKAHLSYAWVDPGHIDMHHTEVPVIYRGQGVAKLLAKVSYIHVSAIICVGPM